MGGTGEAVDKSIDMYKVENSWYFLDFLTKNNVMSLDW
jgi:hypothetical protein